ncbi:helix-turn-helix domain-containing protein [Streptomyces sp. NPDC048825]|uniref:helix-turn-helix domain-containing protein n=1 Tax=Streptomyces sp. NPDC048825 TaxID=3365592 RepID=UPI00371EB863
MGRKYRAYPTETQEQVLTRWGHTVRALWNMALEQRIYAFRQRGYTLRAVEQCRHLAIGRSEIDWLKDLPSECGQMVLQHLDRAYDNFWNPEHPAEFPTFKRRDHRVSIPFKGHRVQAQPQVG